MAVPGRASPVAFNPDSRVDDMMMVMAVAMHDDDVRVSGRGAGARREQNEHRDGSGPIEEQNGKRLIHSVGNGFGAGARRGWLLKGAER